MNGWYILLMWIISFLLFFLVGGKIGVGFGGLLGLIAFIFTIAWVFERPSEPPKSASKKPDRKS